MTLGYDREPKLVNLGDTAILNAVLYDTNDKPFSEEDLADVNFQIADPDNTRTTLTGIINEDGSGTANFSTTTQVGAYVGVATFTLVDGTKKSTRVDFEVIDPFVSTSPSQSYIVAEAAWGKFEDCFDAEQDGPWLQDVTATYFTKDKMEMFMADALFFINNANPPTTLQVGTFVTSTTPPTPTADLPLLAHGVALQVIRHLIRSYVEQPNPVGVQIGWHDRRDYLTRWQSVLQIEQEYYKTMLALFKRRYLGLGQTRVLVSSKAGRLIPAPLRTRSIGRGYW